MEKSILKFKYFSDKFIMNKSQLLYFYRTLRCPTRIAGTTKFDPARPLVDRSKTAK